jgi:hypothetical protein
MLRLEGADYRKGFQSASGSLTESAIFRQLALFDSLGGVRLTRVGTLRAHYLKSSTKAIASVAIDVAWRNNSLVHHPSALNAPMPAA